jgi:DNA-binding transcriptional ArsR family regulator
MEDEPTSEATSERNDLTATELLALLGAVGHAQRLRVLAALQEGRVHVSELARRLGLSRPLLYMHLDRLEKAGLVSGQLELSDEGRAMKYFQLVPFDLHLTIDVIAAAVRAGFDDDPDPSTQE